MTKITKLTSITGTTVVAGGICVACAWTLFGNKEEIVIKNTNDKLSHEGFEVLNTEEDSDDWKTVLDAYIKAEKNTFTGQKDDKRDKESLREECKKQLALNTEESYKLTRKWCVKQQSITEILSKKHTVLTTATAKPEETAIWGQKFTNLSKTTDDKFKDLKGKITASGANEDTLRKECADLKPSEIKTTDETFENIFEKTREFCASEK